MPKTAATPSSNRPSQRRSRPNLLRSTSRATCSSPGPRGARWTGRARPFSPEPWARIEAELIRGHVHCLGGPSLTQEGPLGRPGANVSRPGQRGEAALPQTGVCLPASSGSARPVFSGVDPDRPGSGDFARGLPGPGPGFPGSAGSGAGVVDSPGSAPGPPFPGEPVLAGLVLVLAGLARLVSVAVALAVPVLAPMALALLEMVPVNLGPSPPDLAPLVLPFLALLAYPPKRLRGAFLMDDLTETELNRITMPDGITLD